MKTAPFLGFGVFFGSLVLPDAYKLWKSLYMIFWVRYAFLIVPRLQLPNERVSFGAPFYVGRGHIWILPPTSPPPSNQSIAKILWTSGRAAPAWGARRQCNPFLLHVTVQIGLQRVKAKVPNYFQPWPRSDADAVFMIHNIIRGGRDLAAISDILL
jgi:hypothetical protein